MNRADHVKRGEGYAGAGQIIAAREANLPILGRIPAAVYPERMNGLVACTCSKAPQGIAGIQAPGSRPVGIVNGRIVVGKIVLL